MEAILNLGVQIVLFLQNLGVWLKGPMRDFSFLGTEQFYLVVAPAIFWCVHPSLGLRTGLALMLSNGLNAILKISFHAPRPYWYHPAVQPFETETSFGIPSGHSQNAVVVWGVIAAWIGKTWVWIVAIVLIFLIGLSRIYLGVHFPTDVLAGWAIGAFLLWVIIKCEKPILRWFHRYTPENQVLIALGISLVMILIGAIIRLALGAWVIPESWIRLAARLPGFEPIDPLALSGLISNAGVFFGMVMGSVILWRRGWFDAGGPAWQRLVRYLIGTVGVILLWSGLGMLFPDGEAILPYLLRYVRYWLVGLWVTGLAPMLFIRLKLARSAR
jgi:membrane-associated phospholipid phosphatase